MLDPKFFGTPEVNAKIMFIAMLGAALMFGLWKQSVTAGVFVLCVCIGVIALVLIVGTIR